MPAVTFSDRHGDDVGRLNPDRASVPIAVAIIAIDLLAAHVRRLAAI
jgi:hypothetical protein